MLGTAMASHGNGADRTLPCADIRAGPLVRMMPGWGLGDGGIVGVTGLVAGPPGVFPPSAAARRSRALRRPGVTRRCPGSEKGYIRAERVGKQP
ncbi:hypothetical protein GCM10010219_42260 [Streptomyces netropsis]|nr:hypothetical protein GCM10010219_42260 [Streptomyces netropsis]